MRVTKELFKFQLKSDCPDVETATRAGHYMASYGIILSNQGVQRKLRDAVLSSTTFVSDVSLNNLHPSAYWFEVCIFSEVHGIRNQTSALPHKFRSE